MKTLNVHLNYKLVKAVVEFDGTDPLQFTYFEGLKGSAFPKHKDW